MPITQLLSLTKALWKPHPSKVSFLFERTTDASREKKLTKSFPYLKHITKIFNLSIQMNQMTADELGMIFPQKHSRILREGCQMIIISICPNSVLCSSRLEKASRVIQHCEIRWACVCSDSRSASQCLVIRLSRNTFWTKTLHGTDQQWRKHRFWWGLFVWHKKTVLGT